jgi:arabinogalactan oligomer/maltooligosaccharide transport system substrate-binding protein
MTKQRSFGALATIIVVATMFLAACGGSATSSGNAGTSVNYSGTLTIWHDWSGAYLTAKQAIAQKYMSLHPGVTINLVNQTDDKKTISAVNAGSGPDIVQDPVDHIGTLASAGVILPLDSYESTSDLTSTYTNTAAQSVQFNNHVYGIPEVTEIVTIMYNKKLISASQLPTTTDDMFAFEKSYSGAHPGSYGIVWDVNNVYVDAGFFYGYGAVLMDGNGNSTVNSPAGIAADTYIAQYNKILPKDLNGQTATALFNEGKSAAIIDGPWAYTGYGTAIGAANLGFATLPTVNSTSTPMKPFVGGKAFMLTKNAKNPALAVDFMKYFTNAANQATMTAAPGTGTGEIPSNAAAAQDPLVTGNTAITAFVAQANAGGVPFPNTPYMSAVWGPLGTALTAVWQGSETPTAAMAQAQTAIDQGVAQIKQAQGS